MPVRLTSVEFAAKAKTKHPDAPYGYEKFVYINNTTKGTITCLVAGHGDFDQTPHGHFAGQGCPACGQQRSIAGRTMKLENFVAKAHEVHPHANYNYDLFVYINNKTEGQIVCPTHGVFCTKPNDFLGGHGCPQCGIERRGKVCRMSFNEFVAKAKIVHPYAGYEYNQFVYGTSQTKSVIVCPYHGAFQQTPNGHLSGSGCRACAYELKTARRTKTLEKFVLEAKIVHNNSNYDYSNFVYIKNSQKGLIKCLTHGFFEQSPGCHLSGKGCPRCVNRISRIGTAWLDELRITVREYAIRLPHRKRPLFADGYDPETNTVYEFLGDYFHGNPRIYNPNNWTSNSRHTTFGMRYARLTRKLNDLRVAGYRVVTMWESDFRAANRGRTYSHYSTQPTLPQTGQFNLFG